MCDVGLPSEIYNAQPEVPDVVSDAIRFCLGWEMGPAYMYEYAHARVCACIFVSLASIGMWVRRAGRTPSPTCRMRSWSRAFWSGAGPTRGVERRLQHQLAPIHISPRDGQSVSNLNTSQVKHQVPTGNALFSESQNLNNFRSPYAELDF